VRMPRCCVPVICVVIVSCSFGRMLLVVRYVASGTVP
jgi:hypothetical protein